MTRLRALVALLVTFSFVLVGLTAPSTPAVAATRTGSTTIRAVDLRATYSIKDVVTGMAPRVARISFRFDHPRSKLSLEGLRPSFVYAVGPGDNSTRWAYLVKDSEHSAHADFLLDASDPAGTYTVTLNLETTVDGQPYVGFEEKALTFSVKRSTGVSVSSARSDGKAVVTGRLTRKVPVEYRTAVARRGFPDAKVALYFDPAGSAGPRYRGTVTTSSTGTFRKAFSYPGRGRWVAKYAGSSRYAASGVPVTGSREPAVRNSFTTTDTKLGTSVTMKVVSRNIRVGASGRSARVDVYVSKSGPASLSTKPSHVCARSRIGTYDFSCATARRDSSTHWHANLPIGPSDPASVYDVSVWADPYVKTSSDSHPLALKTENTGSFRVTKSTRTTVHLNDRTLRRGATVRVAGTLHKPSQVGADDLGGWRPMTGQKVKVYFNPKGSGGPVYRGTATVGEKGRYLRTFRASGSGTWIVKYPGSSSQHLHGSRDTVSMTVD